MGKDNGGPAFPVASSIVMAEGMTLRDYFAAKAMQAMLAGNVEMFGPADRLVNTAFVLADAMIAERAK